MDSAPGMRFGAAADAYHRYRPRPPETAVDWLVGTGTDVAVDIGAGTGLFTEPLSHRVPRVFAVERDPAMRAMLATHCPGVTVLEGSVEHIPLPDNSVRAAFGYSAWHWADPALAFPEIARVLVPGGVLGVAWSIPDRRIGWRAKLDEITWKVDEPGRGPGRFELPSGAPFSQPEELVHSWRQRMTVDELVASLGTYVHVLALSEVDRIGVLENARTFLNGNPATSRGVVDVPFRTACFRTTYLG
ncbi:MAG TPA: class I SAM-dependent methyltransferase [Pseudonocardiaceae bacterium]|nr:class I SAM-dependent methyltransferase [Pseudonocardiaceae bacterium]